MEKTISIIIPALNEKDGIDKTIAAVPVKELRTRGYQTQILVIDNGSSDGTGEKARKAGAEVVFEPNRGYGYAYKTGFANAKGEIIVTADADMSYPVEDTSKLVQMLEEEDLDFITTNRYAYMDEGAMSPLHRFGNYILNLTARLLFQLRVKDSQSGMWVFKRSLLDRFVLRFNSMALSEEIKIEACYFTKCKWKEVPIQYRNRLGTVKLRTWRNGLDNLLKLVGKRLIR